MTLRIVTLNVNGLNDETKRRAIFNYYRQRADVLCLQETHCVKEQESQWTNEWGGPAFYSHGESNARGVSILINRNTYCNILKVASDNAGRKLIVETERDNKRITICNIYAPNKDSPGFFVECFRQLENFCENVIVIGDFNLTFDSSMDRLGSLHNNNKARDVMLEIMDDQSLVDIWRLRNPNEKRYSWFKNISSEQKKASRLDFAIISAGLVDCIKETMYFQGILTDHSAMYLAVEYIANERGSGYWKFNNSFLSDIDFVSQMNDLLDELLERCNEDYINKWEDLKEEMRKFSKEYARNAANDRNVAIANLSEKLSDYQEKFNELSEEEIQMMFKTKSDLEELVLEKTKGVIFRSRAKWYCEAERNTKYFYNLEKSRSQNKTCNCLINMDGDEVKDTSGILSLQEEFYRQLYKKDETCVFSIESDPDKEIMPHHIAAEESEFTEDEISVALKQLSNNKTPGPDGLSADFFKMFWRKLKPLFCKMIRQVYENEHMFESSARGIINLIPKRDKDTRFLKNLRPITLLNTDYKIIEKAIANRMVPALDDLISQDQNGFLPGRNIAYNIRKAFDIVKLANTSPENEILYLSLDFEKAFDKVSMDSIIGSLEHYKFSNYIIQWTKTLYSSFRAQVQNNGHFSESFPIERSVHQGAPNSCYYFLLVVELLADAVRNNKKITGFSLKEINFLLSQYADDMDSSLKADKQCLHEFFNTLDWFKDNTGLTINYDKTTIYRFGSLKDADAKFYSSRPVQWSSEGINVLGVDVCVTDEAALLKNYLPIINKVDSIIKAWERRNITLEGKVNIVNALIGSLFVYKMMVLPTIPRNIVVKIEKKLENFLWNGKKPKISMKTLQMSKEQGGLKLLDLTKKDASLKITWVRLLDRDPHFAKLAYENICPGFDHNIWFCNMHEADVEDLLKTEKNAFWCDVVKAWCRINFKGKYCEWHPLWFNSLIRIGKKPVFWKSAFDRGLLEMNQLYNFKEKCFYDFHSVTRRYGLSVMQYNSIASAIKSMLCNSKCDDSPPLITEITDIEHIPKEAYKRLTDVEKMPRKMTEKWQKLCNETISCEDLGALFINCRKVTNVGKYRSFQYRMLHNAIVTNIDLMHWKIKESDLCSFCQKERETVKHLFWECEKVRVLWNGIFKYIERNYEGPTKQNWSSILSNQLHDNPIHVNNFICLVVKQYIYQRRCLDKSLNVQECISVINSARSYEKFYAIRNGKLHKHNKKWFT